MADLQSPHKVEIYISCKSLIDLDFMSESDPFAKLYVKGEKDKRWKYLGRTETITNNHDPTFTKSFLIDYFFEQN